MLEISIALTLIAGLAWDFGRRHLARKTDEYERLEQRFNQELEERNRTIQDWINKFSSLEARQSSLETAVKSIKPSANPQPQYNIRG